MSVVCHTSIYAEPWSVAFLKVFIILFIETYCNTPYLKMTTVETQTQPDPAQAKLSKSPTTTSTTSTKLDIPTPPSAVEGLDDDKTVVGDEVPPEAENKFRSAVEKLHDAIEGYNTAVEEKADQKTIDEHEQKVIQALKETAESSPNPKVKDYYKAKALEFMKVGGTAKKVLTNDIIKGTLFILASPVALLSSVLV
ncbi:hypothetical protein BT96DRAFT_585115 [Gymnopus androsaceus JB14]|uniref:Uncharacterized protein n=1 Tax=Gymnopus androsaceus JB14 TaxID=1447944 RepID=A0A6A4IF06_9AGAR|nr:hypothetical protein BT96DRAFT_585115 [Gymnopus androsaceus JB14]